MKCQNKGWCDTCKILNVYPASPLDPTELLDLIEAAWQRDTPNRREYEISKRQYIAALVAYLKGDPGPLKKLAGVE